MGQDSDAIRQEIEATRDEMSQTIDAIGYKADVPARTREAVGDRVDTLKSRVGLATDKAPSGGEVKDGAKRAAGVAQDNPLGLAVGAVAVGFLAGMLIPTTAKEHETLGPMSDRVKEQAAGTAQEALEHGKQVAQDAAETAKVAAQDVRQTAQDSAREHGEQVKQAAQDNAQTAAQQAKDAAPTGS